MKTKILMCFVTAAALASGQNFYNFDCQTAGAVPALGGPGDCEGLTGVFAFIETAPGCTGMPSSGASCAVVRPNSSAAIFGVIASGATIPRPLPANLPELRLPMAAGTTIVSFDWRAYLNDSGTPYNDGYDVSVCDTAGNRIETVLRGDAATDGGFTCLGFNSLVFQLAAATPAGAYLSVSAYNEQDTCCGTLTYIAIDRLRFSAGNDECLGAVPITCTVYNQNNIGATTSGPGNCGMSTGVWYAFTASQTGPHAFSTFNNSTVDTVISVFDGCEGNLLGCNDQFGGNQSQISLSLTAGQTVYVEVGGWAGDTGAFNLNIIQPFALIYTSPQPGTLEICITGGTPNTVFFAPATLAPGNFPNGTFFGIDISLFDLLSQIGSGAPFIGLTDGNGVAQFGPFGPGLSGLTLYGVALNNVASPGFTASAPVAFTIP